MRIGSSALAFALLVSLCLARPVAAYHFEDTLRGSTTGNQLGGTLGPTGWTVTSVSDRIWYSMPTMVQGSIEFTLSNVTNAKFVDADHEMFTIYEAGYGISEPIDYGHLKPLFYRVMWRLRGEVAGVNGEPTTRQGEQKLIWIMCPDGSPGYAMAYPSTFCSCSQWIDQGPSAGNLTWTGAPERIRFEWDANTARYLRNGVVVDTIDWSGTGLRFTPKQPHFCLGSPRSGAVSYAVTVVGATYSDLVVDGVEGPQQLCPGSVVPDAGTTADAGTPLDAGAVVGTRLNVLQDVTAASWEAGVFPVPGELVAEAPSGGGQGAVVYLKFPPLGGAASSAVLRIHTGIVPGSAGGSGIICRVDDDTWTENTLTWANRPPVTSSCAGTSTTVGADTELTLDVTSLVRASGNVNLAITTTQADAVSYFSKESGGSLLGPRLDVRLSPVADAGTPAVDAGTGVDAGRPLDAGTPVADAGMPADGGTAPADAGTTPADAGQAGSDGGSSGPAVGACGCGLAGGGPWLVITLLLALRRRRHPPASG